MLIISTYANITVLAFLTWFNHHYPIVVRAAEFPGSTPILTTWICVTVTPFSNPRPPFVNRQLICLPPGGIFNIRYVQLYINFTYL